MNTISKIFLKINHLASIGAFILMATAAPAAVDIDTLGTAEPPFLAMGAKPNLLLLLDNSGSMLDLAYDKETCTDREFQPKDTYAGLFDSSKWYYWKRDGDSYYFDEITYVDESNGKKTFTPLIFPGTDPASIKYYQDNLVVTVIEATETNLAGIADFAASGNLLNWASASKFDIQKKILTGGKYVDNDDDNDSNNFLVSEGRGCSSRPYIKEVEVLFDDPADIPIDEDSSRWLTFSIRGYSEKTKDNLEDPTRNLTRIAILGVTDDGVINTDDNDNKDTNYESCLKAIDEWGKEEVNQGQLSGYVIGCLDYGAEKSGFEAYSNSAYNSGLHECWFAKDQGYTYETYMDATNVNYIDNYNSCGSIYEMGFDPSLIKVEQSGYICMGNYNTYPGDLGEPPYDPTTSDPSSYGYVGRCWDPGTADSVRCEQAPCPSGYSDPDPNTKGQDVCTTYSDNDKFLFICDGYYFEDECYSRKSGTGDILPLTVVQENPGCEPSGGTAAAWIDDKTSEAIETCIKNALWDFCNGLSIPEVIDPTLPLNSITDIGDSWGLIGSLLDASTNAYFESQPPLIEMQVNIKQTTIPQGIIQSVATDIRMGIMAFNDNGALTECELDDNDNKDQTIIKYCPKDNDDNFTIYDGAEILTPIMDGNENPAHITSLIDSINDVGASSWTPLAEAVYNALGYYGQDSSRRLNPVGTDANPADNDHYDFLTEDEGGYPDPVENWCQENYILIITEGESTADMNEKITAFVSNDTDTATDKECTGGSSTSSLYGSTYLDDLTYFGQNALAADLFFTPQLESDQGEMMDKQNIKTFIVATSPPKCDPDNDNNGGCDLNNECDPYNLITKAATNGGSTLIDGRSPEQLKSSLLDLFNEIRQRASAGSSASVVSSSRGGEGAVYQAIFWPEITDDDETTITWAGDVRALFIDSNGFLFEDSNHNRQFDTDDVDGDGYFTAGVDNDEDGTGDLDGEDGEIKDKRVIVFYDDDPESGIPRSKACYNISIYGEDKKCDDETELEDVNFLWSAGDWLSTYIFYPSEQRTFAHDYISGSPRRNIYTWNDLNNDGIVQRETEWLDFERRDDWLTLVDTSTIKTRSGIDTDFDVANNTDNDEKLAQINNIVEWVRGYDELPSSGFRNRTIQKPSEITYRLGDVINSTPMAVTSPAENYNQLYNDFSYAKFAARHQNRRHMIYFGANDGMLHAVNGGFYIEDIKRFCLTPMVDGNCNDNAGIYPELDGIYPELGAELWAYVPYNLLPHLKSLTKPDYVHKYYVDLRPRIFDVQIFSQEEPACSADFMAKGCIHPEGWGTILVGGMRLGGAPINANEIEGASSDDIRKFISSYFIFDITDPENPPILLGELTNLLDNVNGSETNIVELGYSTNIPTMIVMKKDGEPPRSLNNQWYLALGSGPHGEFAMKGVSDQVAKMAILPLDRLAIPGNDNEKIKALRLSAYSPLDNDEGLTFTLDNDNGPKGFISDPVTLDMDINPSRVDYMADAVYFGTVDGVFDVDNDDKSYWKGGGKFYRLRTRDTAYYNDPTISQEITIPKQWKMDVLLDAGRPISGALSFGYDGYNFWIYGGTGRFWDADDKTDDTQQAYYGIKEPMEPVEDSDGVYKILYNTEPIPGPIPAPTLGTNNDPDYYLDSTGAPGEKGLLRVDEILVEKSPLITDATLTCRDNDDATLACLPNEILDNDNKAYLSDLEEFIAGRGRNPDITTDPSYSNSADGWYKEFYPYGNRERNLGQATLLGGLVAFTTYQPYNDPCRAEGVSYLYGVYYKTGTAWHEPIFGPDGLISGSNNVQDKMDLNQGLAKTPNLFVGRGKDGKVRAYVQTSTGEVKGIDIENLPVKNYYTGQSRWKSCRTQ